MWQVGTKTFDQAVNLNKIDIRLNELGTKKTLVERVFCRGAVFGAFAPNTADGNLKLP